MFESLENRRLLSVTLEDGVLTITGTAEADQLAVGRNQTMILVSDNGVTSTWDPLLVESILINGLDGNDQIAIGPGLFRPVTANGGAGDDVLRGGPGREWLNGGDGHDRLFGGGGGDLLDGGAGDDTIVGGPGNDRMRGGPGSDRFDAFDRHADLLDGGEGEDFARINRGDRAHNIEHVFVGPRPTSSFDLESDDQVIGGKRDDVITQTV